MSTAENRLRLVRHVALDMDGTIYSGETLFPFTKPFLQRLKDLGIGYTFLTNNSSKSTRDYLAHLQQMGISATADELYTSTQAAVTFIREELNNIHRLYVLGTPSMCTEIAEQGFELTSDDPADEPDAVVVGFDTTLVFERLCRAAYWIKKGKRFIATHPDRVCPTDQPTVLVDCGSICAALEKATDRAPEAVLGKPDPCMIRGILERHKLAPRELAMVGDRLYTDMAMAREAGALSVLVLTGETQPDRLDFIQVDPPPDLVVSSLEEFGNWLQESRLK